MTPLRRPVSPTPSPGLKAVEALGDRRALPDPEWIAALTGATPEAIDAVLAEVDALTDLEAGIRARHRAGGRDDYAQFRAPFDVYAIVRLLGLADLVETGVSSGVSSAHLLLALRANGRGTLHSIDLPTAQAAARLAEGESIVSLPPGRATGWAVPDELRAGWDLHLGPSQVLLPVVVRGLGRVDLFLHDSLHTPEHLTFELEALRPKLAPGAVVLADNTEWTGDAFQRFARSVGVPLHARGGEDLVGLRMPLGPRPPARRRTPPARTRRPA